MRIMIEDRTDRTLARHPDAGVPSPVNADAGRSKRIALIGLLAVGIALRVAFLVVATPHGLYGPPDNQDQSDFHELAQNLVERGTFAFRPGRQFGADGTAWRAPGYPLMLAAVYSATGVSVAAGRILNILLGAATPLLLYALARTRLSHPLALLAAAITAVDPYLVYWSTRLVSEIPFIAITVLASLLFVNAVDRVRAWPLVACSLLLSLATLVRPAALPLLVLTPLLAAWCWRREHPRLRAATAVVVALAVGLLPIFAWRQRNDRVLGTPVLLTTNGGVTFLGSHNEIVLRDPALAGYWIEPQILPGISRLVEENPDEVRQDKLLWDVGFEFVSEHRGDVPLMLARKTVRFWSPFVRSSGAERWASLLFFGPLLPLIAIGIATTIGRALRGDPFWLMAHLLLWVTFGVALVFYGSIRFRSSAAAALALFAAAGLAWFGRFRKARV
jgi:4-amino-4-deoxy-L-arabinose transferase-like glycosyltransferase